LPEALVRHARRLPEMARITLEAGRNYRPRYYPGKVTLFCAGEALADPSVQHPLVAEWSTAAAEVEPHIISGGHHSMVLDESHARELATRLEGCLADLAGK
jgi:hypothetical protein